MFDSIHGNSHTPIIFSHRDEHIVVVSEIFSHSIMQVHLRQDSQSKCREAQV